MPGLSGSLEWLDYKVNITGTEDNTILLNKACLCCPFITIKKIEKKSNLASPVPARLLPLCSASVFILLSSFDIPTLKSWSVLSDPLIQAGGSWTLSKIQPFVPKWGGQREEKREFAPHALRASFNFVTIPHQINLEFKLAKIICSENYNFVLKVRVCKVNIS